ncbi:MAG TPA: hypothetical protein VGC16_02765 [Rhizomicrobium sp.]
MTALDTAPVAVERLAVPLPRILLALAGFTALAALFFWPWLAHLSSALIGPPEDNMQDFWNSWHAVTAHGWRDFVFTNQIRFPQGASLVYHSFAWPQIFAMMLLAKIFGGDFATLVALQNLTLLATFPLAATAMFALARRLLGDVKGRDAGAAAAGFIFAFNPWHVAMVMHHAHVANIEFLPLFVLFYLTALERRDPRRLIAAGAMLALSALCCWYFLFYALYFMAFHLLALRLREGNWPRGWMLAAPVLCAATALLLLVPWLVPMARAGLDHSVYYSGNNTFVADLLAFVAFPPTHLLARLGSGVYAAMTSNPWEGAVYLGLVNLAVLALAIFRALTQKGDKRALYYALGGMAFFAVIACGETLHAGGVVTPIHLPGVILAKLPFFANVRTPARAMVFVYLFLGLALAQAAVMALRHRTPVLRGALTVIAALMLLDFAPVNLATTPAACPTALDIIAKDPNRVGVLDLPSGYAEGNAYMMLSACHGHPIVQGITARFIGGALIDRLPMDPAAQRRALEAAHVGYVVLHKPQGPLFARGGGPRQYLHVYQLVQDGPEMTVLRVP